VAQTPPSQVPSAGSDESTQTKIARALLAAPADVAREAKVAELDSRGRIVKVLRVGSNGFTCMPGDSKQVGRPAVCADKASMQWFSLFLLGAERRSRHDLFLGLRRSQCPLLGQPTPSEELVGRNPATANLPGRNGSLPPCSRSALRRSQCRRAWRKNLGGRGPRVNLNRGALPASWVSLRGCSMATQFSPSGLKSMTRNAGTHCAVCLKRRRPVGT
jgi:hypothetical protein